MSLFRVENICAAYGRVQILKDISFFVQPGEIAGILGANGSGKTTLLKSICGIVPHQGKCTLDGETLETLSPRRIAKLCSYIPQRSGIGISISVLDVVLMGFNAHMSLLQQPDAQMRTAALQALDQVDLLHRAQDDYLALSEGQKQLCLLARSLVSQGKLLLLDEPESALDFRRRRCTLQLIRTWIQRGERAALITLHDPQLALRHCDRLILLDQGVVCAVLHPRMDSLSDMEAALRQLYGNIELSRCTDRSGQNHIVILSEGGNRT